MWESNFVLGRVRGIEIGISWTWLIIFGLVVWSLATVVFPSMTDDLGTPTYIAMAVVAAVAFFGSLLLHELGHALQAEREGMRIEGITLWIFGGVAKFSGMFPSAGAELRVAIAGPVVTFVIATLLSGISAVPGLPEVVNDVVVWLAFVNLALGVFNMLPAFPMDGGRVLRALIWRSTGDFGRATKTAGIVGGFFGRLFIVFGILQLLVASSPAGIWLAMIGWFVIVAGGGEARLAGLRGAFSGMTVADLMIRDPQAVGASLPVDRFLSDVLPASRYRAYPVVDEVTGTPIGLLTARGAAGAAARRPGLAIADCMVPLDKALVMSASKDLGEAALELMQTQPGRALVVSDGGLDGLLSITDVTRWLELPAAAAADVAPR